MLTSNRMEFHGSGPIGCAQTRWWCEVLDGDVMSSDIGTCFEKKNDLIVKSTPAIDQYPLLPVHEHNRLISMISNREMWDSPR